jgi:hypothetical protein
MRTILIIALLVGCVYGTPRNKINGDGATFVPTSEYGAMKLRLKSKDAKVFEQEVRITQLIVRINQLTKANIEKVQKLREHGQTISTQQGEIILLKEYINNFSKKYWSNVKLLKKIK